MDAAAPVERKLLDNLNGDDVLGIFRKALASTNLLSVLPPVLPKEGETYVFHLGPDPELWDKNKKSFGNCSCVLNRLTIIVFLICSVVISTGGSQKVYMT